MCYSNRHNRIITEHYLYISEVDGKKGRKEKKRKVRKKKERKIEN